MALEQHLAPVRKGVRVIREISWRLREIGADGRICDILDLQVGVIEASAEQISSAKPQPAVDAVFAELLGELAEYEARGEVQAKAPPEEEARVVPFPAPAEAAPVTDIKGGDGRAGARPTGDGSAGLEAIAFSRRPRPARKSARRLLKALSQPRSRLRSSTRLPPKRMTRRCST